MNYLELSRQPANYESACFVATSRRAAPPFRRKLLVVASAAALLLGGAAQAAPTPNESAMVQLIRGLIKSGALAKDVGEALLAQAQTEAMAAQAQAKNAAASAQSGGYKPEPGDVRVPYISQSVRDQIRDEIKGQVMAQAKSEGWAAPHETPEWTQRIRVEGDIRVRAESRLFSQGNSNAQIDWAAINRGNGYDVNPNTNITLPPILNTQEDRKNLWRARARLGILADISESTRAGIRLATGSDDSPVSTTQTLGGGLAKKSVWVDQAWLSYKPLTWLNITAGRFGNPFDSTDLLFSGDLNFDGVAAKFDKVIPNKDASMFGTIGVIPLEYSSDNAPSTSQKKIASENKWLLGAQVGIKWKLNADNQLQGALAYYEFKNVSGQVSDPCALYAGATSCSTDWSRPAFMQKGNTLMLLRNIAVDPLNPTTTAQPQYVGLASRFKLFDLTLHWDTKVAGGNALRLDANYVRNLAYNADEMFARARNNIMNNFGSTGTSRADFRSGGNAYMVQATLGALKMVERGNWNVLAGYKRIEPDSMPDGYNDSTFHLGGTNARGYYIGASYAIDKNTWFTGRWTSSKEVYGAPYSVDTLQLDLNAQF